MNRYWVKRDHLINERASMDVSSQDGYVCVMIEEECAASIKKLMDNEPINRKLLEEARERIEELCKERDTAREIQKEIVARYSNLQMMFENLKSEYKKLRLDILLVISGCLKS